MDIRRSLVPYHFSECWNIIPNRQGEWKVVPYGGLKVRLQAVRAYNPQLVVSGDCMAAVAAHPHGADLVWFDAHGDFNTPLSTRTGSLGGMVLAMMRGLGDTSLMNYCGPGAGGVRRVIHVGGTEFDPGERDRMEGNGVEVKDRLNGEGLKNIHLHIDTDVIRCADMPSSRHSAPNGMSLELFWECMYHLIPVTSVLSVKTYDPAKDVRGVGEAVVLELIRRFEQYGEHRNDL